MATTGMDVALRWRRSCPRCARTCSRSRRSSAMRERMRLRSISSFVSPGPRTPMAPPTPPPPEPRQAWQAIFELRQLDLELAFASACVLREDVEDEGRPVDHARADRLFE